MARSIRHDAVLERRALIIERGAAQAEGWLDALEKRLERAQLTGVLVSRAPDPFGNRRGSNPNCLVVRQSAFPDVRLYVTARAVGIHLEVLQLVALEPSLIKRRLAAALTGGSWWAWSLPRSIAQQEDLRTWLTVVETTVQAAAQGLVARLGGGRGALPLRRDDVLEQWN